MQKDSRSSLESASESEGGQIQEGAESNVNHGKTAKEPALTSLNGVIKSRKAF